MISAGNATGAHAQDFLVNDELFLTHPENIRKMQRSFCTTQSSCRFQSVFRSRREWLLVKSDQGSTYRVFRNDCRDFNNLSYTIHLR